MTKQAMIEWAQERKASAQKNIDDRIARFGKDDPLVWLDQYTLACKHVVELLDKLLTRITPTTASSDEAAEYVKVLASVLIHDHVRFSGATLPGGDMGSMLRESGKAMGRSMLLTDATGPFYHNIYRASVTSHSKPTEELSSERLLPDFGLDAVDDYDEIHIRALEGVA